MNTFEETIAERLHIKGLHSAGIDTVQVNVGLRCNQRCIHCHLEASPERTETMEWPVMERIVNAACEAGAGLIDITGGSPEMNPHIRRFIEALRVRNLAVQVRTNLTVLREPQYDTFPTFYRDHEVGIVGSLPCYLEENVCTQRGEGVYEKSIDAIRILNGLGYGIEDCLPLMLVYNPGGPVLPPSQAELEAAYKKKLSGQFGLRFTRLIAIANMPIGRFSLMLGRENKQCEYHRLLRASFNPETVESVMCRRQVSVGWDGTLYDCDFNLSLGMPVDHGAPDHIERFESAGLVTRRIVTGDHCFGCTASSGSSCGGSLV